MAAPMRRAASLLALALVAACSGGRGGTSCGTCATGTVPFTVVDDCHCCKPAGAVCATDQECCTRCVGGTCSCIPSPDPDLGVAAQLCGNAAACCSGRCDDNGRGSCQ